MGAGPFSRKCRHGTPAFFPLPYKTQAGWRQGGPNGLLPEVLRERLGNDIVTIKSITSGGGRGEVLSIRGGMNPVVQLV